MQEKFINKITVADLSPHVHNFLPNENKVDKLYDWLSNWIKLSLECGKIKPLDFLPSKADLACHIGVSQGTIQNVFRRLEDNGFVESKQKIGTYIKEASKDVKYSKLTSKRELAVEIIKRYISENNYNIGDEFISARSLAKILGMSNATIRLAMNGLVIENILSQKGSKFVVIKKDFDIKMVQNETLVEKITQEIRDYIIENYSSGEKIPSNLELAKIFKVSIKTIHDSIKILSKENFLYIKRGQYGTIYIGNSTEFRDDMYFYEKFEMKIKNYISKNYNVGDKLPTMKEFAGMYKTSEKTIRKALNNLAEDGYIIFSRGRYGGTFVADIPQESADAYKWLVINNEYFSN